MHWMQIDRGDEFPTDQIMQKTAMSHSDSEKSRTEF